MFLFEMQMGLIKAWTDAAESGVPLCTETFQRTAALTQSLPGSAASFSTNLPMTWPFGWPMAGWSAASPFTGFTASPFTAMMPWARFANPSPANFFGWPMSMFAAQPWPLAAMSAFAPMAPTPWPSMFSAMPSPWTAPTPAFWFQGASAPARQAASTSYRSAGGHATATIAMPAEFAQSMSDFWTAWTPGARRTLN